ncbi:2555_t:CDS:2 [Entrophospora sp. SA101]|nr:2555_t:CDS:2 [Entrophospora sp. SA101]
MSSVKESWKDIVFQVELEGVEKLVAKFVKEHKYSCQAHKFYAQKGGYNDTLESRIEELKEKIMEAVEMMHSQGWIHGDMRLKNIMFKQDNNNEWKVKLINFDWAGKEGYASYPLIINRKLPWH